MVQVRADEENIVNAIQAIVRGNKDWATVEAELPIFEAQTLEASG